MRRNSILNALLGSLLLYGSVSARTPDGTEIHAGGRAYSTVEAGNRGLHSDRESFGSQRFSGERQQQQQQNPLPSTFYRALSKRSVGRYILATSSLVGECARVYTPAPVGAVASSLWNRFGMGLGSHGRDRRGSSGQNKSSGFSYDRFMSTNNRAENDEDMLHGDGVFSAPAQPDKYGRVSAAFLARHEIGGIEGLRIVEKELEGDMADPVPHPFVFHESYGAPSKTDEMSKTRRQSTETRTGSVLKSIASLGRDRNKGATDDMDLLSDSEDVGDECHGEGGGKGMFGDVPLAKTSLSSSAASGGVHSGQASAKSTIGRNLVDADDNATKLVNRLRLGKKTESGESRLSKRRRARRSRQLKNDS